MRLFPNLPLRHRLTLISVVTSAVALLLTGAGFIAYELHAFKRDLAHEVAMTAQMIGYHSASALSFNDPKSAQETLQGLGLNPHIEAACIYDIDGRVFAVYPRGFDATKVDRLPAGAPGKFGANRLELFRTIDLTGEAIGTIYLRSDLREMSDRLGRYALIIGGVMLLAIVVAYVFALHLQRAISGPVAELAAIAGRVGAEQNYSARAVKNSNDELGQLIDGFNDMLGQIEGRDAALRQAHDRLERRVQERTAELAGEQARFKFIFDSVPVGISLAAAGNLASPLVNPAHARITGVSTDDAAIPDVFVRATHPEDYRRQHELMQPFVRGEVEQYSVEKRYVHPDDRVVWVILTSRRFIDPASGAQQSITTLVDITERKSAEADLAATHRQLIATSRLAGMAEVATGVLHNVGNVLNSVNVSATLLSDHVRHSKSAMVGKAAALLEAHEADLAQFLTSDPSGRRLPGYLKTLAGCLADEQKGALQELDALRNNIEHIKGIVAMQQSYAKVSGVAETVGIAELVEDALRMNSAALQRHEITLVRDFQVQATITVERHKVLQILVNLIRNAKYACDEAGRPDKQITLQIAERTGAIELAVIDNGVGIPAENLTRIFGHGFTTRKDGHGFGLHSGALAAREIGAELGVRSDGPGRGATFTLRLPFTSNDSKT